MQALNQLTTEGRNPASERIDTLSPLQVVELMNAEDSRIAAAVAREAQAIARGIEVITDRIRAGGRLVYTGAGTSGRLGVLDAAECPPTFSTPPEMVVGMIAGGYGALLKAVEGAEDKPELAVEDLQAINLSAADVLVGIATSGRTPYVIGGLAYARRIGAFAIGLACNDRSALTDVADLMITPVVGPEVISGSTRLKAGTATKLVLNMLSTGTMVQLGKTYGNLMVDLKATNTKLMMRSRRIAAHLTGLSEDEAQQELERCGGELKTAIVAYRHGISPEAARERLVQAGGQLRGALDSAAPIASPIEAKPVELPAVDGADIVLGIDGGGTKTVAWLARLSDMLGASPLGVGQAGPGNPRSAGFDMALENIAAAIRAAFQHAGLRETQVASLCLALAGADRAEERQRLDAWARQRQIAEHVRLSNDAEPILAAAAPDGPGMALICGTGSFALARSASGEVARCGGWGYLIGDEGSGYAIGLAGLRTAARAADGRGESTCLLEQMLKHFQLGSPPELIQTLYGHAAPRQAIAELAGLVFLAAAQGDSTAARILDEAAEELTQLVVTVAKRSSLAAGQFPLAVTGGILLHQPKFRDQLEQRLALTDAKPARIVLVSDPVCGAVAIARQALQRRPPSAVGR